MELDVVAVILEVPIARLIAMADVNSVYLAKLFVIRFSFSR